MIGEEKASAAGVGTEPKMENRSTVRWQFKVCLIGDGYVGKTSIRRKYLRKGFKKAYYPTIGVDFAQRTIEFDGISANLVIWDIAGQTTRESLRKRYYDGASGLILVFSIMDRTSFENASKWLIEARSFTQQMPPIIIAANKIDLYLSNPKEQLVSLEEGKEFTETFSEKLNTPMYFIETSALDGTNIDELFHHLVKMMVRKISE
jgi:small GTP-binding protein